MSRASRPRLRTRAAALALPLSLLLALAACSSAAPAPTRSASSSSEQTAAPTAAPTAEPSTGLTTWRAALADRDHAPANWVALGDSLSEGQGSSTLSGRWIDRTLRALRTANPTEGAPGGVGYRPAKFAVYGPDSNWGDWSSAASGSSAFDDTIPDLGYRALSMQAGASRTYRFTGTDLDIWWARYQGSGAFEYTIDSGSAKRVDTDGADSASQLTAVHGLSAGRHTATITATGAFDLEGLTIRNGDRAKGITLFDSTHSGATVSLFTADRADFLDAVARTSPDLVTITLGGNEAQDLTAAQFRREYLAFVRSLQTLPSRPSVLVIGEQQPSATELATIKSPWSSYEEAMRSVASSTGAAYVDLAPVFPPGDGGARPGISTTDQLHPNDTGQREIAAVVGKAIGAGS